MVIMAERRKNTGSRYDQPPSRQRRNKKKSFSFPWFSSLLMVALGVGGFLLFGYLGVLDYNVRKQFEGKRWAIPARVYASPVEL
jgi:penicillin-binding protein 1B